jgi:RNA polymerase sigma-70 factor, ECF subfamily
MNSLEQDERLEPSDADYVASSRNGHPEEFQLLVQRYQRPLFAYLTSRLRNSHEAEEAAQESFVRAFMSLEKLRKPESFYAWLMGIAGRVLKEQFRATERRQREAATAETLLAEDAGHAPEYPLEEAIAALPESNRQVILLRFYEGHSCQEIATRLGMPLGTVTKTLSRAYALLRQELQARENAEATVI